MTWYLWRIMPWLYGSLHTAHSSKPSLHSAHTGCCARQVKIGGEHSFKHTGHSSSTLIDDICFSNASASAFVDWFSTVAAAFLGFFVFSVSSSSLLISITSPLCSLEIGIQIPTDTLKYQESLEEPKWVIFAHCGGGEAALYRVKVKQ